MGFVERLLLFLMVSGVVGLLWFAIIRPLLNHLEKKYGYKEDNNEPIDLPEELNELKTEVEQDVAEAKLLEEKGKLLETAVNVKDKLLAKKEKTAQLETQLQSKRAGKTSTPASSKSPKQRKET